MSCTIVFNTEELVCIRKCFECGSDIVEISYFQ